MCFGNTARDIILTKTFWVHEVQPTIKHKVMFLFCPHFRPCLCWCRCHRRCRRRPKGFSQNYVHGFSFPQLVGRHKSYRLQLFVPMPSWCGHTCPMCCADMIGFSNQVGSIVGSLQPLQALQQLQFTRWCPELATCRSQQAQPTRPASQACCNRARFCLGQVVCTLVWSSYGLPHRLLGCTHVQVVSYLPVSLEFESHSCCSP